MSRDDDKDNDRTESVGDLGDGPDRPRIKRLGHFRIDATLGSGGMGTIYRAYDESMKRPVALKVLHSSLEISQRAQSRFVREAWIAGQLDHPNIVKVYSRGEENNVSYLAMELAEGGSLYDFIKRTRESIPFGSDVTGTIDRDYINDILGKFIELAGALEHIHSKGFIHRDIKPHNILLSDPDKKFKLTDFGIAHADDMTRMTRAGDFIGTVKYMSPELLAAHRAGIDKRTDIYSLGVTLYEALTLTLPFKADSEEKLIGEILAGHYIEARQTNRRIPVDLETVLMKASHHDPDRRYQTAGEFAEDLQRIIDGRPILARRPGFVTRGYKYVRRNYKVMLGIALAASVVVSAVLWSYYQVRQAYRLTSDQRTVIQASTEPTFTKIEIPGLTEYCALSPDGDKIAFVANDSCLWITPTHGSADPTVAGAPIRLTEPMVRWTEDSYPVWSADGNWIAFNGRGTCDTANAIYRYKMFVIPALGGEPREVPTEQVRYFRTAGPWHCRISLSPDGENIAFATDSSIITGQVVSGSIFSMSIDGAEIRQLTDSFCDQPCYSPDGKMVAYVRARPPDVNLEITQSDIWVTPVAGGVPIQISTTQGLVRSPVWSQDSRHIAFNRLPEHANPDGEYEAKELYIANLLETYQPEGPPVRVNLPISSTDLIAGWSSSGEIGMVFSTPAHGAVYSVPATGGMATQITSSFVYSPSWSPDGSRLYFMDNTVIRSIPAEGGIASTVPITGLWQLGYVNCDVSPDGKKLTFPGIPPGDSMIHIYTVPAEGGEPLQLTFDPIDDICPRWSPDGVWIAFVRQKYRTCRLYVISSTGEDIRELTVSDSGYMRQMTWSPDGKSIAYSLYQFHSDSLMRISIIPFEGGQPEEIVTLDSGFICESVSWSPDGSQLCYCTYFYNEARDEKSRGDVWVVPLDTRIPKKLRTGLDLEDVWQAEWSPDGDKIAVSCRWGKERDFYLIKDFLPPSQPAEPKSTFEPESKKMTVRMVWSGPEADTYGAPSPDGRYLSYVDWETGNLAIRELASGRTRHLTTEGTWRTPMQFAMDSRMSPDGKSVAYSWWEPDSTIALHIIGIDGSAPRVLYSRKNSEIYPKNWSSNGKWIIAICHKYDTAGSTTQLAWVSPEDGSVRVLKSMEEWGKTVCHSPDDKYLAYDYPVAKNSGNFDVFLLATDGSGEIPLVEHPANDKLLGWAPDRQEVLFISDRSGTWDAWIVRVANGRPQSSPQIVKRNIGEITSMAFTQDGSYFYSTFTRHFTTYVAPFDLKTGVIQTSLGKPILGSNFAPQWSPDGKRLAYVTEHFTKGGPGYIDYRAVEIQQLETGEERELAGDFYTTSPRWSPDGRFILATGYERNDPRGEDHWKLYRIDVQTDEITVLADHDNNCVRGPGRCLFVGEWSGDGTSVFYVNHGSICRRDIEKDWEERLYHNPDLLRNLYVSPDGKTLIFHISDPARQLPADSLGYTRRLMIMSLPDGDVRELLGFDKLRAIRVVGWTPDCKHLIFQRYEDKGISLWKISSEGGDPRKLWQLEKDLRSLSLHPDGEQIAFHTAELENEIWVMENFLPED